MATSLAGVPYSPSIPGRDTFNGVVRHSTEHDSSREWIGKRVLVVGTSSSGFDTAYDFARRGVDVTILQRSPTYIMSLTHSVPRVMGLYKPVNGKRPDVEVADRLAYGMPVGPGEEMGRRLCRRWRTGDSKPGEGRGRHPPRHSGTPRTGGSTLTPGLASRSSTGTSRWNRGGLTSEPCRAFLLPRQTCSQLTHSPASRATWSC
jgi:hypothetical protein